MEEDEVLCFPQISLTFCTESIVNAAKRKGNIDPMITPLRTTGSPMCTFPISAFSVKAVKRESAVRTAEPMANPFPVAAVVFPRASIASVVARTLSSMPAISAMPPTNSGSNSKSEKGEHYIHIGALGSTWTYRHCLQ